MPGVAGAGRLPGQVFFLETEHASPHTMLHRPGMSRAACEETVLTALALAMSRDGSSGGLARLVTITKEGADRRLVRGDDIPLFWDEIEPLRSTAGGPGNGGMIVV